MLIRRELDPDRAAVRRVHTAAFPTTLESDLLDALRADAGWLPRFSLVAELDGAVVGHVVGTRPGSARRPLSASDRWVCIPSSTNSEAPFVRCS